MLFRHVFFLILKSALLIQFFLILVGKENFDSSVYILTEIIFKTCIGIFMNVFIFTYEIKGLLFEDKILMSFAGGLLLYDAWINDFPTLLKKYNISVPFL